MQGVLGILTDLNSLQSTALSHVFSRSFLPWQQLLPIHQRHALFKSVTRESGVHLTSFSHYHRYASHQTLTLTQHGLPVSISISAAVILRLTYPSS